MAMPNQPAIVQPINKGAIEKNHTSFLRFSITVGNDSIKKPCNSLPSTNRIKTIKGKIESDG
jgi:hypothetical protein